MTVTPVTAISWLAGPVTPPPMGLHRPALLVEPDDLGAPIVHSPWLLKRD
jgi:hypothetical protein